MTLPFDLLARLRLWSPLSPQEASLAEKTSSDAQSRLEEVSRYIEHLEAEVNALRKQSEELERFLSASQGLRAPIRTLPLELLSEIFARCTETEISCSDPKYGTAAYYALKSNSDSDSESDFEGLAAVRHLSDRTVRTLDVPAAVLCQVCTTWNSVISTSSFAWSRISLSLNVTSLYQDDGDIIRWARAKLAAALARSGQSPLYASFRLRYLSEDFSMGDTSKEYESLVSAVFQESHRWKAVELEMRDDHFGLHSIIVDTLSRPMPLLQSISISLNGNILASASGHVGICNAPLLRHVDLNLFEFDDLEIPIVPWSQLHSLEVKAKSKTPFPFQQAISVLAACSSLELLRWSCPLTEDESNRSSVLLSQLQTLDADETFNPLMPYLTFPHLCDFRFHIAYCWTQSFDLAQQLDAVRPIVTSLKVNYLGGIDTLHTADVWRMLGNFPEVKSLSLRHILPLKMEPPSGFFDGPQRFPKLQSMSYILIERISRPSPDDVTTGILKLVDSFRNSVGGVQGGVFPTLRNFMICFEVFPDKKDAFMSKKDVRILREFAASGLDFEVYRGDSNFSRSNFSDDDYVTDKTILISSVLSDLEGPL